MINEVELRQSIAADNQFFKQVLDLIPPHFYFDQQQRNTEEDENEEEETAGVYIKLERVWLLTIERPFSKFVAPCNVKLCFTNTIGIHTHYTQSITAQNHVEQ